MFEFTIQLLLGLNFQLTFLTLGKTSTIILIKTFNTYLRDDTLRMNISNQTNTAIINVTLIFCAQIIT